MRYQSLVTIAFSLLLQRSSAAPSKRCMTQAEITNFQANWPKSAGLGPVIIPCSAGDNTTSSKVIPTPDTTVTALKLRATEIEALAKRYLADERSAREEDLERRCMTDEQISAFQAAWPEGAGVGPALVACST